MRRLLIGLICSAAVVPAVLLPAAAADLGYSEDAVVGGVRRSLRAYHDGADKDGRSLRVVYFHPKGVEPQADFQGRITRTMFDIKDFLDSEMKRIGFASADFPLELDGDAVKVHVVEGKDGADGYEHKSGGKVQREIARALQGVVNLRNDFVLIFNGMCEKTGELSYRFYAPYYGDSRSNHRRGLCHVADCEIQDPALLKDSKRKMSYKEHTGDFTQTVAEFNTKYLGGVAHELGHGLSLPHNCETQAEKRKLGTALMGAGNHTYRREVRGGKGSFLTVASAVRLAAHPLFTGSDRGADAEVSAEMKDVTIGSGERKLTIAGSLVAEPPVHAVIAYVDREGRSDYDALTTVAVVEDGKVELAPVCGRPGKYELRLVACHANGAVSRLLKGSFEVNEQGKPDVAELQKSAAGR